MPVPLHNGAFYILPIYRNAHAPLNTNRHFYFAVEKGQFSSVAIYCACLHLSLKSSEAFPPMPSQISADACKRKLSIPSFAEGSMSHTKLSPMCKYDCAFTSLLHGLRNAFAYASISFWKRTSMGLPFASSPAPNKQDRTAYAIQSCLFLFTFSPTLTPLSQSLSCFKKQH